MTSPDILALACEQFLGKDVQYIKTVILQTLEGHLRAILGRFLFFSLCFVFSSLFFYFYPPPPSTSSSSPSPWPPSSPYSSPSSNFPSFIILFLRLPLFLLLPFLLLLFLLLLLLLLLLLILILLLLFLILLRLLLILLLLCLLLLLPLPLSEKSAGTIFCLFHIFLPPPPFSFFLSSSTLPSSPLFLSSTLYLYISQVADH